MITIYYDKNEMDAVPKEYSCSILNPFWVGDGSWENLSEEMSQLNNNIITNS